MSARLNFVGPFNLTSQFSLASGLIVSALTVFTLLGPESSLVRADVVSFDTSDWDHGAGSQTGWVDGQLFGQTSIFGNQTLTISSQSIGSASATSSHFTRLNAAFFTGFAFQLVPGTTNNAASLSNYERLDFSFSTGVSLDSFTLTDMDRANGSWWDVIVAEGFATSTPGAVGTGTAANYAFEPITNLSVQSLFGLQAVTAVGTSGNVQNTPEADVTFSFAQGIRSFSIYYWNFDSATSGGATQTIGIRNNSFDISRQVVPEPGVTPLAAVALLSTVGMFRLRRRRDPAQSARAGRS